MKKKILILLAILNISPICTIAQNSPSTGKFITENDNTIQIEILKNEIAVLKKDIDYINEKSLNFSDMKDLIKKNERNSPIWMIMIIVVLYIGIFIFLGVSVKEMSNMPSVLVSLLERELKIITFICVFGVLFFFICIFIFNSVYFFIGCTLINFVLVVWVLWRLIQSLNISHSMQTIVEAYPEKIKDFIEFYINKREFETAYNLLCHIKNYKKLDKYKQEKIKIFLSSMHKFFENENFAGNKIFYRKFFEQYVEILFETKDFQIIKDTTTELIMFTAGLTKQKKGYYSKLYDYGKENFVFIIEKAIKDNEVSKEESFIKFLAERFVKFSLIMIRKGQEHSLRHVVAKMVKIIYLKEFKKEHFDILKKEDIFSVLYKKSYTDYPQIDKALMFFLYRVTQCSIEKKIPADTTKYFTELLKKFVVDLCDDSLHWTRYSKKFQAMKVGLKQCIPIIKE